MIGSDKQYVLVLDTETANTLTTIIPAVMNENGEVVKPARESMDMSNVLVYDCGWAVADTDGTIYETASFVNRDIFNDERDLMRTAYYNSKIPNYVEDLRAGRRKMANTWEIRQAMLDTVNQYGIKIWAAYNARFDRTALDNTQRYHTASKYRYWFPFDSIEIWDIMKMARDVVAPMPEFIKFCHDNNFIAGNGKPRTSAEVIYRFIIGNPNFEESHTALEDVMIETAIMAYCFRQNQPMRKNLYDNPREWPESTEFQRQLYISLKQNPMVRVGR